MRKTKNLITFVFIFIFNLVLSQTIEIGTKLGTTASSIDDSDFFNDKPSIGKKLWSVNYGVHSIFYLKNPRETKTGAILLEINSRKLGVKSKTQNATYEIDSKSIEIVYRMCGDPDKIGRFFFRCWFGNEFFI